jgi:hypothetical protein
MRNLIFLILLLLVTTSSFGQFEIGLNGGVNYNTVPTFSEGYPIAINAASPSALSGALTLQVMYNYKKWKFGVEADRLNLSFKCALNHFYFIDSQLVEITSANKVTATLGNPAVPLKVFAERKFAFRKLELYAGISAGYVFLSKCYLPQPEYSSYLPPNKGHGITMGLRIGATHFFTKRIGINGELSADYMNLHVYSGVYKVFTFPATLGIRYKL